MAGPQVRTFHLNPSASAMTNWAQPGRRVRLSRAGISGSYCNTRYRRELDSPNHRPRYLKSLPSLLRFERTLSNRRAYLPRSMCKREGQTPPAQARPRERNCACMVENPCLRAPQPTWSGITRVSHSATYEPLSQGNSARIPRIPRNSPCTRPQNAT